MKKYQLVLTYHPERTHVAYSVGSSDEKDFEKAKEFILTDRNGLESYKEYDKDECEITNVKEVGCDKNSTYNPVSFEGHTESEIFYEWIKTADWAK